MFDILKEFYSSTGFANLEFTNIIMILVAVFLITLSITKKYEPYLLIPIAFGMLLVNLPLNGLMSEEGLFKILYLGIEYRIYPPLIFLGIGASTDFGALIANPKSLLLGAAAQFGIFIAFFLAIIIGFNGPEAASIGIIGGADGPTAIFLTSKLAADLVPPIAIAAYSYMALVPIIQPPIIKLLTTKEERQIKMVQLRQVSKLEKIIFPVAVSIVVILIVPSSVPLIGMFMFGNLLKESQVVPKLVENANNSLMYIITILIGLSVGAKTSGGEFLTTQTLSIISLGLIAFIFGTASGVLFAKVMNKFSKTPINPMIGAAGVSAVPMAARVVHKMGLDEDKSNFLLMHAMGPNVAGVIGSAIAAGVFYNLFT
jgi:oxaloacetate decarboxylase beta subunit